MANDLWRTPKPVFDALDNICNFVADMACTEDNKLCELGFTEDDDSLSFCWATRINELNPSTGTQYVWLNCPYSNPMPWVKQALKAQANGLGVVMLLNNDSSTGWFAEALKGVSYIVNIVADPTPEGKREYSSGRIAFIDGNGNVIPGNNKPQVLLEFSPSEIGLNNTSYIPKSEFYKTN